jgi:Putative Ig domain
MKTRYALLLGVFALGCLSTIGCGATTAAKNSLPANPGSPANPSSPSSDPQSALEISTTQLPDANTNSSYSAQLSATGGMAPYTWSASGELPAGLTMSSTGAIAGTPTSAGQSMVAVSVKDSEDTPQTAQVTLALDVANAVQPANAASGVPSQFYGAGRGADSLANCVVGPYGDVIAYRFVADHSGSMSQVRFYIISNKAGYAGGDAGALQVNIESDDGTSAHNPSGTVLATATLYHPVPANGAAGYFPLITFPTPANLTAGDIYHVVFTNVDANPSVNFSSVDELYYKNPTTPNQPTVSDVASSVLRWRSGTWEKLPGYSPIFELYFSNGDYQGYGYVEAFVMAPELISGSQAVRETFTVTGATRSVSSIGVRLARISGSGNLTVRLENSAGTLIEQGYLAASSFPVASPASHVWATYTLANPQSLVVGQTYHLVLEAPSSTEYQAYPMEKGSGYGFDKLTYFPDGYAQFNPGTGWVGWSVWGVNNRTDGDLQFYFGVNP